MQECIDFIDQEIRDYKTLNVPAVVNALIPIKQKFESIRDNQEREIIAVNFEDGFRSAKKSSECIGGIRYYNEKYGNHGKI